MKRGITAKSLAVAIAIADAARAGRAKVFGGLSLAAAAWMAASCGAQAPDAAAPALATPGAERSFQVRGVLRGFPEDGRSLLIRHEEIPGYMPKMTMELTLLDTNEMKGLAVGDILRFRLVAREEDHFIDQIRKEASTDAAGTATREADPVPVRETGIRELKPGDPVPAERFVLETGEMSSFEAFRGQALAFTFFFSRCPLPDFCPRMNRNFADARMLLKSSHAGVTNWQFLSLSFDAEFDKPAVLSAHATSYRGESKDRWAFAAADAAVIARLAPAFGLMLARDGGGYSHNLRTVVVDPLGHVFRQFDGNRWTPADLAEAIAAAAQALNSDAVPTQDAERRTP